MRERKTYNYKIVGAFDTETTTIKIEDELKSFPILWTFEHIEDIETYEPNAENVRLYRTEEEVIRYIISLVDRADGYVPILCVYNLMFDIGPILDRLASIWDVKCIARSTTGVYCLDLYDGKNKILRIWDVSYLQPTGLATMGHICGVEKLTGSWDYTKIRTSMTPLTEDEEKYAAYDVHIILSYLRWVVETYSWVTPNMLGNKILTATSIVRQFAKHEIYNKKTSKNKKVGVLFDALCRREEPNTFEQYGIRRACYRGGLVFTAANYAFEIQENVASIDAVSMYHAFINGRRIFTHFVEADADTINAAANTVLSTTIDDVLYRYDLPFSFAFHAKFHVTGLRLRGIFEKAGIATLSEDRFLERPPQVIKDVYGDANEAGESMEQKVRSKGYMDTASGAQFAFGKLIKAKEATLYLNEIELWVLGQVYEFDSIEALTGEVSVKTEQPPDYITLQSNLLYKMKQDMKHVAKTYKPGEKYNEEIGNTIPQSIATAVREGTATQTYIDVYYSVGVKGPFNSIYGTQVQNLYQPGYLYDGEIKQEDIGEFEKRKRSRVLFTYGLRIAAGSRMHLVIAIQLLAEKFGERVKILAGDTDSIKMACTQDVTNEEIQEALAPLHDAIDEAINICMTRVRREYPDSASDLKNVGHYEIEACGNSDRYKLHMVAWNKCRIALDSDDRIHMICAGLARPEDRYSYVDYMEDLIEDDPETKFRKYAPLAFMNVVISKDIAWHINKKRPDFTHDSTLSVTDYNGVTSTVTVSDAISLYMEDFTIGGLDKLTNIFSFKYMMSTGRDIEPTLKYATVDNGTAKLYDAWSNIEL